MPRKYVLKYVLNLIRLTLCHAMSYKVNKASFREQNLLEEAIKYGSQGALGVEPRTLRSAVEHSTTELYPLLCFKCSTLLKNFSNNLVTMNWRIPCTWPFSFSALFSFFNKRKVFTVLLRRWKRSHIKLQSLTSS